MNRLPEVKKFIYDDVKLFHNVEFKKVPGAPPVLKFLNEADEVVEEVEMSELNREQLAEVLTSRGFYKKESEEAEVPEKFQSGPYYQAKEEL